jgi:hypothetical protein
MAGWEDKVGSPLLLPLPLYHLQHLGASSRVPPSSHLSLPWLYEEIL